MEKKLYELTEPQKSIWLTEGFSKSNVNIVSGNIYIHESIDTKMLEKALNIYVQKNDAIRMRIVTDGDSVKQFVHPYVPFTIPVVSLNSTNDLPAFNNSIVSKSFSLIDSDLFSFTIFKFNDNTGGLNVTFHHIISDAWTMSLFIDEVMDIYTNLVNKVSVNYDSNSSYINYIFSERDYLSSSKFEKDKEFWNSFFTDVPELAKVTDKSATNDFSAVREVFHLEQDLYEQIKDFCEKSHCSTYTFFMAIFLIYLSKSTNVSFPVIGTPFLNRTNFKEKRTAGMYISTIPFGVNVDINLSFSEFLKKVSSTQMSIFRHQKYPYSTLLEDLKRKYNYSENLYQVALSYQNAHNNREDCKTSYSSEWLFDGNIVDPLEIHFYDMDNTGKFDIYYDYQTSRLSKDEVCKIHEHVLQMISQVISSCDILVKDIEIVTPDEKDLIINKFNDTAVYYDKLDSLVSVFEKYASIKPNDVALVFEDKEFSYGELNEKANRLANYLISLNIESNSKVAIMLPRGFELILAMIAIKKANCAYLLIEKGLPTDRISYMMENAEVSALITNKSLASEKDGLKNVIYSNFTDNCVKGILFEDIAWDRFNKHNLNLDYLPENSLSVVYTSGSTGTPKGILLKNSSILNLVLGYCYSMQADTFYNFLSICSVSFDMFAAEVWIPLLLGKKLILANEEETVTPSLMANLIEKYKVQFMLITSSRLDLLLLHEDTRDSLRNLKAIQLGGEVLSPKFYEKLDMYTDSKIYNGYGPSETTSCATCKLVSLCDNITIGKPLPNVQVYICNNQGNLCPINMVGELCISGDGVSYGYINSSELTSKSFVPNPFGAGFIYKTGDLAKWLPNGEIAFMGRSDSQVKLRGLRIEVEEINRVILSFSGIQNCITTIKKVNGIDSLCAYFIGDNVSVSNLKSFCSKKLPYYMVPSHFVHLESFPLTINGKIDVKCLPDIEIEACFVEPSGELENSLSKIWQSLFHLDKVSVTSNFFDLGGDSLMAIRLGTEIEHIFNLKVSINDIFTYSTIRELAEFLGSLKGDELLDKIEKVKKNAFYPASSAQKRIYYASSVDSNSILYNIAGGIVIDKVLDITLLQECFEALIKRHEVLRTRFSIESDNIVQIVEDNVDFTISTDTLNSDNLNDAYVSFVKPFDLTKAPLFRASAVTLPDGKMVLLLDMHHIICDGVSLGIFLQELCDLYNGKVLPEKQVDYKDFTLWEKGQFDKNSFKKAKDFWVNQYQDEIPLLNMPTTYERPFVQSFEGANFYTKLPKDVFERVSSLSRSLGITPYMLLLCVYYVLLSKYTSQNDIIIGSVTSNRDLSELSNMLGMFVNTLALRSKVEPSCKFSDFAKKLKEYCLSAFQNQIYPFDELVKALNIKRDTSRNSIFDVMFVYQSDGYPSIDFKDCETRYFVPDANTSKFDLTLEVIPNNYEFELRFEYCTKLFDEDFVKKLSTHYVNILNTVLDNADLKISDIDMLSLEEKNQILYDFNNTKVDYPRDKTIVDLFEEQVLKTPDSIAVVFEEQKLTYRELNEKANQLARYLMALNSSKQSTIGILLKRSLEVYICMLGILKSGNNYMLIDYNLPNDRIEYMLKNSNSTILLTDSSINKNIDIDNTVLIDKISLTFENTNLEEVVSPISPSCVIYTSGSTGTPKGVMLTHRGIVNMIVSYEHILHTNELHTFFSMSTVSFDMFAVETYISLLSGGTIVLTSDSEQQSPKQLQDLIIKHNVEFILTTPSKIELLMMEKERNCLKNVKVIQLGGEVFTSTLYKILKKFTNASIYNGYGPTEITACCSTKKVIDSDISIGTPFCNTKIFICDKNLNLLPIGVIGELCVSGDGLSLGYINNKDLTEKSFVKPNFYDKLIYRTGDLAYIDKNGEIRFIGRNDNQVKLRGLRIELNEISSRIKEISGVKNSIVLIKEVNGNKSICAYISVNSSIKLSQNDVKSYLKQYLPEYMVPSFVAFLEELPLTINGKIDTKKLPEIKSDESQITHASTEIEVSLENVCKRYLSCNVIDINTSLFDLGGDSLFAIKLSAEIYSIFKVTVSVKDIFEHSSIKELAHYISTLSKNSNKTVIKKIDTKAYYPASSAQKRIYYASSMDSNSVLYNIAGGIVADKVLDIKLLQKCFEALIKRHEVLRTRFEVVDSEVVQIVEDKVDFTLSYDNVDSDDFDSIYVDFLKPFDLTKAPLFRARAVILKDNRMFLLLDMHHIISDGTSLSILMQELCDLYNGKVLAEKQIDYKDFTLWEKEQFDKDSFKKAKDFWVSQYQDEIPLLNMPTTYVRSSVQSFEGANFYTKLPKEVFDRVNVVAKNFGVTPYMLFLAVYYVLLAKYTSQDDIVIGTPVANRENPQVSSMLGMFVNTLALRNKVNHSCKFSDFAKRLKEYCLSAFDNQIYPFDELVKTLNTKRDTSRNPLFDVMFIYQNNGYPKINFKNIYAEYYIPDGNVSKFDLTLEIVPINDEFSLRFEYCTKLFDEDFVKRLALHYVNILNAVLENQDIKISDINMLSEDERRQILYEFNDTKVDYPRDKTIVDLFEEQVQKNPDSVAIVFEDQKLTYKELNERANQLARYLIENGISNNSVVGIMLHRSLEMIISMFGILKAGATYLPLDPNYPKNRIQYIIKDSGINVILTKDSAVSLENTTVVNVSLNQTNIYNRYSVSNLDTSISPNDLAYIIYTSGSTGNPKGVTITHKNVNNFIKGTINKIKFDKVIVSVTTICFDIFVLESILPLENGLTVVIANESEQTIPELLNRLCIKNNVTMIQTTPSKLSLLISDENSLDFIKNIRTIMLGGEHFPYNLLLKLRSLTKCKIYNMYGPTETTVWSSIKDLTDTDNITIGKPISNTTMYVLDNKLNLLPINVPGKLYIGGEGVSKGYFNNQNLTDSKFVTSPFDSSKKIYDTGDLAKWSDNGELICLGRSDFQVKIRGLRIELGEIENVILTFKGISKTIVTASTDSLNRQILCAYIISKLRVSVSELKQYLSMFLPNYMLPTYIMQLDDFKYTPNGKIDQKSLPKPDVTSEKKYVILPKTTTECKIAKIWEELLCISPISINDNFFEIGGDSLLALKMQMQLLRENINITYGEIFKYNTVKKLSSLIDKKLDINNNNTESLGKGYDYSNIDIVLNKNKISNLDNISYEPIGDILLTGITGFLGAHILDYLIKNTSAKVYCLVRKDPSITLLEKVLNKLHFYFGNVYDDLINKRIFIINSDLTQYNFGLTDEKLLSISAKISCVINSAAIVKHYGDYREFEAINVTSVKELISFCEKYNKKLVQISTISVSGNTMSDFANDTNMFSADIDFTESNLYIGQSMENVYVHSKFEAEKLILEEISKCRLNALILRIGNITNRFTDGKFQFNAVENAFANKLKAFIEISALPDYVLDKYIEFSPVDYVAEAVVKSIEYANKNTCVLHIYNPNHVYINNFINLLPEEHKISIVSDTNFKQIINNILKNNEKKYIISHILNDLNNENKLVYDTHIKIKSDFSQKFLKQIGFSWPIVDKKYIEYVLKDILGGQYE